MLTRELNGVVLLALKNIQQRIDKTGLRFGLENGGGHPPAISLTVPRSFNNVTHIFEIQLRLLANTRIRIQCSLDAVSKSCDVHLRNTLGHPSAKKSQKEKKTPNKEPPRDTGRYRL